MRRQRHGRKARDKTSRVEDVRPSWITTAGRHCFYTSGTTGKPKGVVAEQTATLSDSQIFLLCLRTSLRQTGRYSGLLRWLVGDFILFRRSGAVDRVLHETA